MCQIFTKGYLAVRRRFLKIAPPLATRNKNSLWRTCLLTHSPLMLFLEYCTASLIIIYTAALSSLKENGCCSI